MFELTISTTIDKQNYIEDLFKKLEADIKLNSGVIIKQNYRGRSHCSLAIPNEKKEYYKSLVLQFVVLMIIDDYKFNFYQENLKSSEHNLIFQPFLKAISIFDSETDTEFIKRQIDLSGEILVDSLYYFKLGVLKERWARTIDIINQNRVLQSPESMTEVLKYLTSMSENGVVFADAYFSNKQIKLSYQGVQKCFKKDFNGVSNFLTEVVKINPLKLNIKRSSKVIAEKDNEIINILSAIFNDKIYIIN